MNYIVMEMQTIGETAIVPPSVYSDRNTAERAYHLVLAAAAVSNVPIHAAVLMTSEGETLERKVYTHMPE